MFADKSASKSFQNVTETMNCCSTENRFAEGWYRLFTANLASRRHREKCGAACNHATSCIINLYRLCAIHVVYGCAERPADVAGTCVMSHPKWYHSGWLLVFCGSMSIWTLWYFEYNFDDETRFSSASDSDNLWIDWRWSRNWFRNHRTMMTVRISSQWNSS